MALLPAQAFALPPGDGRADVGLIDLQTEPAAEDAETGALEELTGEGTVEPVEYEPANAEAPAGGEAAAKLASPTAGTLVQAGDLPVLVGAPEDATTAQAAALAGDWGVELASAAQTDTAEVKGVLLTVTPPATATGEVDIALDYSEFEQLYSADWADRMQLVQLPACFLTTPDTEGCTDATYLTTENDDDTGRATAALDVTGLSAGTTASTASAKGDDGTVSDAVYRGNASTGGALKTLLPEASASAGSAVVAAVDSGSGAKGDFTATPLASAGSWSAGGSSGAFTYTYSVTSPTVPAGPTPTVAFQYNSQVVDGRTSVSNNQASWIGDGWDYNPGSIETTYRSCSDDTAGDANNDGIDTGDLCQGSDNAVLSLGGSTTELVKDDETGVWTTANGDGSKVDLLTASDVVNGDNEGEYWRITARDGTKYYFGRNTVTGWTSGKETTDSVLTVPVAGNQVGEPCYHAAFKDSFCQQAWRWNLDFVVDPQNNVMSLWWDRQGNYYAKNSKYSSPAYYHRASTLDRIEYGQRMSTFYTAEPVAEVDFTTRQRCFAGDGAVCTDTNLTSGDPGLNQYWYDTPADLYCADPDENCYVGSPTFFNNLRLYSVTTKAQRAKGDTALYKVDSYTLAQSFPRTLTDTSPPLWLESVTRTGFGPDADAPDGDSEPMASVEFSHNNAPMPNRVVEGASDPRPAFDRLRIRRVVTEYGGEIDVEYSTPKDACSTGSGFPKPEENAGLCYPVYWSPDPAEETIDWFNKYVVTSITEKPRVDGVPDVVTSYDYDGGGAWALNQTEFSKKKTRTYDQWHGYGLVYTKHGTTDSTQGTVQSKTATRYFRGMDGDPLPGSQGVRDVSVYAWYGTKIADDHPAFQGAVAETITFNKAADTYMGPTRTVTVPTAVELGNRSRDNGIADLMSYRVQTARTDTYNRISATGDDNARTSALVRVSTTYDSYGLPTQVDSEGDTGVTGDETCTVTEYLNNTSKHIIGAVKQVRTTAGRCSAAATATADDVVSGTRSAYDGAEYGTAPTYGLATKTWTINGAGADWIRTSTTTYDDYGRIATVTDAGNNQAKTTYAPTTGQVYSTTATNALGYTSTTTVDPGRGTALTSTDANGNTTTYAYDALGRATAMWTASQDPATDKPSTKYTYAVTTGKPTAVTGHTLRDNGTYEDSVTLYDGLGRVRQTQSEAAGGGRLITDTHYNSSGTVRRVDGAYLAEGEPTGELFEPVSDFVLRSSTVTTYDGMDRPLTVTPYEAGTAKATKRTTYEYGYDYTKVIAPTGAASTRTYTDQLGRAVRVDHYTDALKAAFTSTHYTYDTRGNRVSATDADGNEWEWKYDARGRQTKAIDPDTGTTVTTYDDLDRLLTSKNANGTTVWTGYDALGRSTGQRLDSSSGKALTSFTYDTVTGGLGQPATSTRYTGDKAYTTSVTGYDDEYRPTGKSVTIPEADATKGLSGTYTYGYTYTATGKLASTTVPAVGGIAKEDVVTRYDGDGLAVSTSGEDWYTAEVDYSPYGEVLRAVTGEQPYRVWTTNVYNENTGQLSRTITDRETADTYRVNDRTYAYDAAGNITILADTVPKTADDDSTAVKTDRQCFTYDVLGQPNQAWTSNSTTCAVTSAGAPNGVTATVDGDGYWQTYHYDAIGNRDQLVDHSVELVNGSTVADATLDVTTSYEYGIDPSGSGVTAQPHTLTTVTSDSSTVDSVATVGYDASGNAKTRMYGGDTQSLTWTWDGKVETVTGFGAEGEGQAVNSSGKCLDLSNGSTTAGTALQLYTCNGTKPQRLRIDATDSETDPSTGALKVLGHCVMPSGGATANNTAIVIADCTGAANQQWTATSSNTLKHVASGKCLDVPNGDYTTGKDLQLYTCNSTAPRPGRWATTPPISTTRRATA